MNAMCVRARALISRGLCYIAETTVIGVRARFCLIAIPQLVRTFFFRNYATARTEHGWPPRSDDIPDNGGYILVWNKNVNTNTRELI